MNGATRNGGRGRKGGFLGRAGLRTTHDRKPRRARTPAAAAPAGSVHGTWREVALLLSFENGAHGDRFEGAERPLGALADSFRRPEIGGYRAWLGPGEDRTSGQNE